MAVGYAGAEGVFCLLVRYGSLAGRYVVDTAREEFRRGGRRGWLVSVLSLREAVGVRAVAGQEVGVVNGLVDVCMRDADRRRRGMQGAVHLVGDL